MLRISLFNIYGLSKNLISETRTRHTCFVESLLIFNNLIYFSVLHALRCVLRLHWTNQLSILFLYTVDFRTLLFQKVSFMYVEKIFHCMMSWWVLNSSFIPKTATDSNQSAKQINCPTLWIQSLISKFSIVPFCLPFASTIPSQPAK